MLVLIISLLTLHLSRARAATLSDPEVDKYNVRVGTQTFAGVYQFTTNTLLVETANAIHDMGSDMIKMYIAKDYPRQYHITLPSNVTNLLTLARDETSCRHVLDMPFRRFIAWIYPFSNPDAPFQNGYTSTEANNDYREVYDLTHYLLTNYNNSGKTFYLGHWEGDGYFTPWTTNPSPTAIQGMIDWQNTRQKAMDDAKASTTYSNVAVYYYAEANRVRDAMLNGPTNNQRVINMVVPYVTNLDYLSYSSYDAQDLSQADLYATLDYMQSMLPTNKASVVPGERIWIGEYGHGGWTTDQQEPFNRAYIQNLLNWGSKGIQHILYWEMYDNETNADGTAKNFCLIDTNNNKVASYYLHQRYLNSARLLTAQFKETNGRVPTDSEFVGLVSPMLNQPLPAPVNLTVSNVSASILSNSVAALSGLLAQGVYGDDRATLRVFWGRQDGGTVRSAWEQSQTITVNSNFNPTVFSTILSNLISGTNYFFRFYAANSSGEAWAPASSQLLATTLNPSDYGTRLKISFPAYNRSEVLTNFKALVNFSASLPGFSYRQFASGSGGDLRFTDSGGTMLIPHEIDEWNTNGVSSVWVQVPRVSNTNDFIWAYWGNPAVATPPPFTTNGTVWMNDHFLVWHLKENNFPFADSSQQHPANVGGLPVSAAGEIGRGCLFDGASDYLEAGTVNLGNNFTLSAWVNLSTSATNIQTVWANKAGGFSSAGFALFVNSFNTGDLKVHLETGNGSAGTEATSGTGVFSLSRWHLLAASINRTAGTARLYLDGSDITASGSIRTDFYNQQTLDLARMTNSTLYLKGTLDEARVFAGTASSNWVWASWMTVASNANFAAYSTVTQQPPALSLSSTGSGLALTWPASGVGFALYTTTNLTPPIVWSAATNQPVFTNSQWQITLPAASDGSRFYRLQSS